MKKFHKEFKIGLLALLSGVILYFGFNFLKGADVLSTNNTYFARYNEVSGLSLSNQVLLNGFSVGRVVEITIEQGDTTDVLVGFDIRKDILVGKNAVARLVDTDLLGGKAIEILTGDISNVASNLDTLNGDLEKGLPEIFADKALPIVEQLDSTILFVNNFLSAYTKASEDLRVVLKSTNKMILESQFMLTENRANFVRISTNLSATTDQLKLSMAEITPMLQNMHQLSDSLALLEINKTMATLNNSLEALDSITTNIKSGEGTIGKMVYNDSLYNNLNQSAAALDRLLNDLQESPKRYVHFSLFGKKDKEKKKKDN